MNAPSPLTPAMSSRKLQLLGWVKSYILEHGESPATREIAAGVGIGETRAKDLVRKLIAEGRLQRGAGKQRRLMLPDDRDEAIRKLREAGYIIDEDILTVRLGSPLSHLPILPRLRHLPSAGTGGADHGDQPHG